MDLEDLRVVKALAQHGTLSGAGRELGVRHTTISRRIAALESRLGTRMFDHTPEGYVVTTQGAMVVELASRVELDLHGLEAKVIGDDKKLRGTLRIATMDILFRRYMSVFREFVESHPDVEVTFSCSDDQASLRKREADVALRMTNAPPDTLVGRKIDRVDFAVYASKQLVERVGRRAPLQRFPWLHWDERMGGAWLDAWLAQNAPGARVAARMDVNSSSLRDLIVAGIGVHFLATFEGDADDRLQRISDVAEAFSRDVWLLTLPELQHNARARALMDHVAGALGPSRRSTVRTVRNKT